MSLILEALKKSEANRRLGQAPDLGTPFTPARRGRSPLWALIVIVLALGAGAWWWFGRGTPAPLPAAPQPTVAATSAPSAAAAPAQHQQSLQQEDKRIFNAARRDSNAQTPAAAGKNEQIWVAAQRHDASGPMADRSRRNGSAQPTRTPKTADMRGVPQPHSQVAPPQPHLEVAGQPHPQAAPPQPHPEVAAPQPHPQVAPPQPHPEVAGQPHPQAAPSPVLTTSKLDVPSYYDLPFATRKALPQLRMSMHVYTADPKQRFVILDGARMVEGDATTDDVTLREIRPDGVVLEFQGQRFFFPRDGL
ncbi:MAG TPA: general secretion pathway protein GspB [Rudaea sp.]|nr:general secretion pathway protein GspB [Rudaea sp.]